MYMFYYDVIYTGSENEVQNYALVILIFIENGLFRHRTY